MKTTLQKPLCIRVNEEPTQQVSKRGQSRKLVYLRFPVLFRDYFVFKKQLVI